MSAVGTRDLVPLARALAGSARLARVYPAGHPLRVRAAAALEDAWAAALGGPCELVLDFAQGTLRARGASAAPIPAECFAARGTLRQVVHDPAELAALLEAGAPPAPPADGAGRADAALAELWRGIRERRRCDARLLASLVADAEAAARAPAGLPHGSPDPVAEHAFDTARIAARAADAASGDAGLRRAVVEAALLADVGLAGPCAPLLAAPRRLDDDERRAVRAHVETGAAWLLATPGVPDLCGVVAFEHHARRDGSGYPVLRREAHPVSRLVAACDTWAALLRPRSWRPALDPAEARRLLRQLGERGLDPEAVAVVLGVAG